MTQPVISFLNSHAAKGKIPIGTAHLEDADPRKSIGNRIIIDLRTSQRLNSEGREIGVGITALTKKGEVKTYTISDFSPARKQLGKLLEFLNEIISKESRLGDDEAPLTIICSQPGSCQKAVTAAVKDLQDTPAKTLLLKASYLKPNDIETKAGINKFEQALADEAGILKSLSSDKDHGQIQYAIEGRSDDTDSYRAAAASSGDQPID